ncbi:hypothetical protein LZ198_24620 [Myxococcus sp. K15C18031901]|uniref:hypothetical protein n=1 Tax=Myxococcus dinghuensis TaxID=2906761 RepID=UPI0020A7AEC1|nr:hypothetical protein [Myxococcus dinghuensis]MCP3102056.1 hypothetical protein [Myxococcus dinghuensis]
MSGAQANSQGSPSVEAQAAEQEAAVRSERDQEARAEQVAAQSRARDLGASTSPETQPPSQGSTQTGTSSSGATASSSSAGTGASSSLGTGGSSQDTSQGADSTVAGGDQQSLSPLEQLDTRPPRAQSLEGTTQPSTTSDAAGAVASPGGSTTQGSTTSSTPGTGAPGAAGIDPSSQQGQGTVPTTQQAPWVMLSAPSGSSSTTGTSTNGSQSQTATQQGAEQQISGEVVQSSEDAVLLSENGEPRLRLQVGPQTQVTLDGFQSVPEDLQKGTQVNATYRTDDSGEAKAVRIDARSAQ